MEKQQQQKKEKQNKKQTPKQNKKRKHLFLIKNKHVHRILPSLIFDDLKEKKVPVCKSINLFPW